MEGKDICISCFCEKNGAVCGRCGFAETEQRKSSLLPARTLLGGRYLIGEVDSVDETAVDYKAWDSEESRIVEIQEYFPRTVVSRENGSAELTVISAGRLREYENNIAEIKINAEKASKVRCSDMIEIYDSLFCNNTVYVVKEYAEGMYLSDFLEDNGGKFDAETATAVMIPVLNALTAVHKAGLFHGAISSQNIILTVNNEIKISDYGFLKTVFPYGEEDRTVHYAAGYAPPESYRSNGVQGSYSDIYSAAAVLYRVLIGRKPSDALNRMNGERLVPPIEIDGKIPPHISDSIMKAMNMEPDMRFGNAADFIYCLTAERDVSEFNDKTEGIRKYADMLLRKWIRRYKP